MDYNGWMCDDLATECPDCALRIVEPGGDLSKFLSEISEHIAECPGVEL